jgi:GT2 family glycosyltransferase
MSENNIKMKHLQLAVLITCHNRRNTTLACLHALYQQDVTFEVYLVDDGSSDGTSEAIKANYPPVNIIKGDGNLFWVGGMRLAFSKALKNGYNYYLWLNDDTILDSNALPNLLDTHKCLAKRGHPNSIVVGSVRDPLTGKLTYGGRLRSSRRWDRKLEPVEPTLEPIECDTMQGNCVLIPHSVAEKVGNIDATFIHTLGDIDYGLRARQLGCSVCIAPGYLATCSRNSIHGSWADTKLSMYERLKKAFQTKGFPPQAWAVFLKRHSGSLWFIHWFRPYIRAVIGYRNLSESSAFDEKPKQKSPQT